MALPPLKFSLPSDPRPRYFWQSPPLLTASIQGLIRSGRAYSIANRDLHVDRVTRADLRTSLEDWLELVDLRGREADREAGR